MEKKKNRIKQGEPATQILLCFERDDSRSGYAFEPIFLEEFFDFALAFESKIC